MGPPALSANKMSDYAQRAMAGPTHDFETRNAAADRAWRDVWRGSDPRLGRCRGLLARQAHVKLFWSRARKGLFFFTLVWENEKKKTIF